MKQTKSLLTLFLTAALALANIGQSRGGTYADPSDALPSSGQSGKYFIQSFTYPTGFAIPGGSNLVTIDNALLWTVSNNGSDFTISGQDKGGVLYYFSKLSTTSGSSTKIQPNITGTAETVMIHDVAYFLPASHTKTEAKALMDSVANGRKYYAITANAAYDASGNWRGFATTSATAYTSYKLTKNNTTSGTTNARYALAFHQAKYFTATANASDNNGGQVYASLTSDFTTNTVSGCVPSTTTNVNFKAVKADGYNFAGWFTNPTCTNPVPEDDLIDCSYTDEQITVAVSSTSTTESTPTITNLYANFISATQKLDFAYTWNCGDVIYGDEAYSNLITVLGENTPSYTLTVVDGAEYLNVDNEDNVTSFETKDYVGADQTITFHIYSEGNDTYKGIDEDFEVTLRPAPNHLPFFVTSNSQYDLLVKTTTGTISCDAKGVITVTRHYSNDRNMTFAWHGEAKQVLFDYRAVHEYSVKGTCTVSFTWLDKASNVLGISEPLPIPATKVDDSKHILNAPAGARQLQMTFEGNLTVNLSNVALTENNPATYNVQYLVPESHGTATGSSTTGYAFEFGGEPVLTHPYDYVILSANPETGYYVREWYYLDKDNKRHPLSKMLQQSYEGIIPSDAVKVSAEFSDTCFVVDDTQMFTKLSAALAAAHSGSVVRLLQDYTVPAGNYTIPAGVTLLIPNNEEQTTPVGMNVRLLMPKNENDTWVSPDFLNQTHAYCTLTLASGANITVNGAIEVTGDQYAEGGLLQQLNGVVAGPYGQIVLNSGSKITLNSNSTLRAWGYITGAGTIDAKDGSIVREFFQLSDWRGGGRVLAMLSAKQAFPTTQYYIQNIESAVTYYTGAQLITKAYIFVPTGEIQAAADDIIIIGEKDKGSPMFFMERQDDAYNTWVRKSYDAVNDRQVYMLNSSASLGSMHINIKTAGAVADMNSKDFVLPITNNMDIILNDGMMNITQSTVLLPGATIQNAKTSTIIIQKTSESSTGSNISCALYLTDVDEYAALGVDGRTNMNNEYIIPVFYSPSWTNRCPRADAQYDKNKLADAELFIHGSLDLYGSLYTTAGGANIHSTSEDAGTIRFSSDAAAGSTLYQKIEGDNYAPYAVTAAQLRNDNGKTVSTEGTKANQSYNFYQGAWRCWETEGCLEVDKTDQINPVYYAKPQDYVALKSGTEDADHLYHSVEGSRTLILTYDAVSNCQWWEVTKVPNEDYYFCATNGIYYYYEGCPIEAWVEKTAQVKFVNSDKTLLKEYKNAIIGTTVTLPDNPSHPTDPSNYDFAGWSPEPGVITGDITFTALYTQRGVTIEDKVLTTNQVWDVPVGTVVANLILNASANASCQIKNIDNLIVKGNVYLDYTFNAQAFTQAGQQWYAFGVPFEVNATSGISYEGASLGLGTDIDILYYDGATRAANGKNGSAWKYVDAQPSANRILRPGVLYLAAFRYAITTVRFTKDPHAHLDNAKGVASVSSYASLTADPQDRGWNGIANPALFYATLDAGVTTGQVYQNGSNSYLPVDNMATKSFVVGAPVFVQVDATKSVVVNPTAAAAPVRKLMTKTSSNYSVALSQNGKLSDRVIVAIDDYATDEYTIGQDLAKAGVSTKVAQMWVERYEAQLCKNTVAADNNMAEYPLTIFAPKAGEYTIALEQTPTDGILFLTENGNITWNLNIAPATLDLSKGTDTTYGLRLVRKSGNVVTGNEEAVLNSDVQKVIINDRLYILRDGKVYNAHGHVIK